MSKGHKMSQIDEEIERFISTRDTVLHLNYNNLNEFPQIIIDTSDCRRVRRIYAKQNALRYLPQSLGDLTNLVELYLPFNKLEKLPIEISHLINLQSLDCCNNELTAVTSAICKLSSLERLKLSFNHLTHLPEEIYLMENLQVLEVMNNKIKNIPWQISLCPCLVRCLLDSNNIHSVPPEICRMKKLEELSLSGNHLICLPPDLGETRSLKSVYVNSNPYLHALPVGLVTQEIGFSRAADNFSPPAEILYKYHWVDITGNDDVTKRIYLPLGTKITGDMDNIFVPSLAELAMKLFYSHWNKSMFEGILPIDLCKTVSCPLAHCYACRKPIFSETYPMIFEGQIRIYELYRLALCCSWRCVRLAALIVQLPLIYPDPSQLNLAVALVGQE